MTYFVDSMTLEDRLDQAYMSLLLIYLLVDTTTVLYRSTVTRRRLDSKHNQTLRPSEIIFSSDAICYGLDGVVR